MSAESFLVGFDWPYSIDFPFGTGGGTTLDANGEKVAYIGRISIEGRGSKTLDTSGSSKIIWSNASAPVFDNAGSEFRVGFQGVDNTTGVPVRPNGTWSVYASITTAGDATPTLTTTSNYHEKVPTSGTVTLAHGDLVAFVMEMTTRAGSDAVIPVPGSFSQGVAQRYPAVVTNVSGSWAQVSGVPHFLVVFSDGTLGTIEGAYPTGVASNVLWDDSSGTDEYGMIFQVPFDCKADAFIYALRIVDAASDLTLNLWSTPEGTPSSLLSKTIAAENFAAVASEGYALDPFASEISLSADTDYCVSIKATGASSIRFTSITAYNAGSRVFMGPAGTTMRSVNRNNGSGAFGNSNTTLFYPLGIRISEISGFGGGGGILTHPGMAGGMRG